MDVTVRRVRPEETDRYREVRLRALAEDPDAFATTHEQALARLPAEWEDLVARWTADPAASLWIAEADDGRWVALAAGVRSDDEPGTIELVQVWSAPEVRRTGVARRILEAIIAAGRDAAPNGFGLWVASGNDGAARFYESIGFVATTDFVAKPFFPCDIRMVLRP